MPNQTRPYLGSERGPALIAICVPTYARSKLLSNCLAQIAKVTWPEACQLCLIVVDNDAQRSAAPVFDQVKSLCPFETHYFCESQRGIASARNRLLEEAVNLGAQYVAFVDDDELPEQNWLVHHMHALKKYGSDVSHGPVIQITGEFILETHEQKYLMKKKPGSKKKHVNSGNVVFDIKLARLWGLRFDPFFNQVGGEDHDFFDRSRICGAQWVWAQDAIIYEPLVPERQSLCYLFSRHYSGGVDNVLKYAHSHSWLQTGFHFLLKITGKVFSLARSVVCLDIRKFIKDAATLGGYLFAFIRTIVQPIRKYLRIIVPEYGGQDSSLGQNEAIVAVKAKHHS
jgi:succinoglycan biosynthesis protein ExoM